MSISLGCTLLQLNILQPDIRYFGFDESCVPAEIAWAVSAPKETYNICSIGTKISISSSYTRT